MLLSLALPHDGVSPLLQAEVDNAAASVGEKPTAIRGRVNGLMVLRVVGCCDCRRL